MTPDSVRDAYADRAAEYIDVLGSIEDAAQADRDYVLSWARSIDGPVLDVGCGPGQWTNYLLDAGIDVEGVDPVQAFIGYAGDHYPLARYRTGYANDLGVAAGSLGGVLAWFSLIHIDPAEIDESLNEFARCIRPGGSAAIGFFDGPSEEPFDHAVSTAFYWSVEALTKRLERAGFTVTDAQTRKDSGVRRQGVIVARR